MSRVIELSTGKKIGIRDKKGQHHFIERKLISNCIGSGGSNVGGYMTNIAIQNIVAIESIDGEEIKTPENLAEIFELMNKFDYKEWDEFETANLSEEDKEKLDKLAKNLQASPGSETE